MSSLRHQNKNSSSNNLGILYHASPAFSSLMIKGQSRNFRAAMFVVYLDLFLVVVNKVGKKWKADFIILSRDKIRW